MCAQGVTFRATLDASGGPTEKTWRTGATLIRRSFAAFHSRVEDLHARGAADVVTQVDDERVLGDAPFVELLEQRSEVGVDVLQHSEELRRILVHARLVEVMLVIRGWQHMWAVSGIEWNIGEERLLCFALRIHPSKGLTEEQVGAI